MMDKTEVINTFREIIFVSNDNKVKGIAFDAVIKLLELKRTYPQHFANGLCVPGYVYQALITLLPKKKISAMGILRMATDCSLLESKEAVDAFMAERDLC